MEELQPRYNIAPSQEVPIIGQADGHRRVSLRRWGLVPFWAKNASITYKLINARAETDPKNERAVCITPVERTP